MYLRAGSDEGPTARASGKGSSKKIHFFTSLRLPVYFFSLFLSFFHILSLLNDINDADIFLVS